MKRAVVGLMVVVGIVSSVLWWTGNDAVDMAEAVIEPREAPVIVTPDDALAVETAPPAVLEETPNTPVIETHEILVLDVLGKPHPNATVFLLAGWGHPARNYVTNDQGLVDIPVDADTRRLVATAPERGLLEYHVEPDEALPNFLHLIAPTRVVIHVTRDGAPFPATEPKGRMRLETQPDNPFARDPRETLALSIGLAERLTPRWVEPGRFVIDDVTPGRRHFRIHPGGHASANVHEGGETTVFIEASHWPTLAGTVTVNGVPREGVSVSRVRPSQFGPRGSSARKAGDHLKSKTTTAADGRWTLPGAPGSVHVVAQLEGAAQEDELITLKYGEHRDVDLDLDVRPRQGVVVDELGLPIEGAYVNAIPHGGKTTTLADGSFELAFCGGDARELHAGYQSEAAFVDLADAPDVLRVVLTRRGSLAVNLTVSGLPAITDEQVAAKRMSCEVYDASGDLFDREPARLTTFFSNIPVGAWSVALVSEDGATSLAAGEVLVVRPPQTARMELIVSADVFED